MGYRQLAKKGLKAWVGWKGLIGISKVTALASLGYGALRLYQSRQQPTPRRADRLPA